MPEMLIFNSSKGQRKSISPESRSNSMSSTSAFLNSHSQILPLPVMENQASPQSPSHLVTSSSGHGNQFVPSFIPPNIIPQRDPPFMHFRHTPIEVKPSPIMNMNVHSANQPQSPWLLPTQVSQIRCHLSPQACYKLAMILLATVEIRT